MLENNKVVTSKIKEAKGDPEDPLSELEIKNKFENLTFERLGSNRAKNIYQFIMELNSENNMSHLWSLIKSPLLENE